MFLDILNECDESSDIPGHEDSEALILLRTSPCFTASTNELSNIRNYSLKPRIEHTRSKPGDRF